MRVSLFAVVAAVAVMSGCACAPSPVTAPPASAPASTDGPGATLYVARRRWHIDVGFAVGDLHEPLARVASGFPQARYVFFGFGDRRYLMAQRHDVPVLLAALWPGAGLILVTSLTNAPQQAFGPAEVVALPLTSNQALAVQDFVGRSLSRDAQGTVTSSVPGPYEGSAYLAAVPRYSAVHTCITWAAEALQAAGLPVRSRFTLLAAQLWRQLLALRAQSSAPGASVAGGRTAVLADYGGTAPLWDDHGGFGGRGRAATADAASE